MSGSVDTATVVVVGGGLTGLAVAFELASAGIDVVVLEADAELGGLASSFRVGDTRVEKFYHHWFLSDVDALALVKELGLDDRLRFNRTRTGIYYANTGYRMTNPLDLLRFRALSLPDRLRLGWMTLMVRRIRNWKHLEHLSAREWILAHGGRQVYRVVWEPLLNAKFGASAEDIGAVWLWNKLKLRGGSRGRDGSERLVYLAGGFMELVDALANAIHAAGGRTETMCGVNRVTRRDNRWVVATDARDIVAQHVVVTTPLPHFASMIGHWADESTLARLRRIQYLGNVCLVLELTQSLSETYWMNVNDPGFPFAGVIEHTNMEPSSAYAGRHIVYLSAYVRTSDARYSSTADEFLEYALPYLMRMYPAFRREWIIRHSLWKAECSQPLVEKGYSAMIPESSGYGEGLWLCTMAQIYPEDRGTNYAIRNGRALGRRLAIEIGGPDD